MREVPVIPSHQTPSPHLKTIFKLQPNKNIIFRCRQCFFTIFVLILYSLNIQVMLILILIDVQYSQKADFSFEKGLNRENHSSSGSHHPIKKSPQCNFQSPLPTVGNLPPPPPLSPLPLFAKPWGWKVEEINELHICLWSLRESLKACAFCSLSLPNTCVPC